ncbi:SPOR domain-containing protein [Legionella maioricensis]|uniref:SPOR domain-containing protein n=1 Tax=Legionella maioricensis TaxID=2896528 RepID=A0A9X2CYB9_9GAMM|nr:SPOR domain-containing protein [Legionella maioricensis]MCL9682773.1 SPOR domain-containing protein [Legionella maioricensis]MCL9686599.1 SPOR domain-containing protein [Legionella maioricensis]
MARQYGNKRSSRQRGSAPQQFLVVIVTFLLGYLTASVFDVETISHWMNTQVLAHQQVKQQPVKAEKQQAQLPPKPKFEFYTLLANEKAAGTTAQSNANSHSARPSAAVSATQAASTAAVKTAATHPATKQSSNPQQRMPAKVAEARPSAQAQVSKGSYLVQVASFKARQDAEHMKGMLILKGFNVNVVPVQARGGWFRVVVGPYSNRVLAQKAQETLARNERLKGMITSAGA